MKTKQEQNGINTPATKQDDCAPVLRKEIDAFEEAAKKQSDPLTDFIWTLTEEPHASRRRAILAAHPEVRQLFGHEWRTKYMMAALVALQIGTGIYLRNDTNKWYFWVTAYVIGGTATQALFLGVHETSHFLSFKTFWHNKAFNLFANTAIVFPYTSAFILYHTDHHKYLGVDGMDVDLPTRLEAVLFRHTITKLIYSACFIVAYALRPALVRPLVYTKWHFANIAIQAITNAILVYLFGWGVIVYLLASIYFATSLHPCAAHFLAEHLAVLGNYETYSYYGVLNRLTFNVGYHSEHHDFPNISWRNLPKLREIAHEFYDELPQHRSWLLVMWKFIVDPTLTLHNRIVRADVTNASRFACGDTQARKWE